MEHDIITVDPRNIPSIILSVLWLSAPFPQLLSLAFLTCFLSIVLLGAVNVKQLSFSVMCLLELESSGILLIYKKERKITKPPLFLQLS